LLNHPTPISTLFPYTTLFRSPLFHEDRSEKGVRPLFARALERLIGPRQRAPHVSARAVVEAEPFLRLLEMAADDVFERVDGDLRSEEHTSELQSRFDLVCRLL